jgi:DNA-directed RNA polymerase subunit L
MHPSSILVLPTSLHKSQDEISIKGETKTLINVIRMIICANTIANQTTKLKNNKI